MDECGPACLWQVVASMPNLPLVESSCEDLGHGAGDSLLIAVLLFYVMCECQLELGQSWLEVQTLEVFDACKLTLPPY